MTMEMDYGSVNHRIAQFDKRHGESIFYDHWIRFEDGAAREENPLGLLLDPPTDPWDRMKRIEYFHRIKLARAVKAFDSRKKHYAESALAAMKDQFTGPPIASTAVAVAELKQLAGVVKAMKSTHDKAVAAVEAAKPQRLRDLEASNNANRQRQQELLTALDAVKI
jgi:hypothetical protein